MQNEQNSKKLLRILMGAGITTVVLALFFYWFRIANRSVVFLYDHNMGPLYPDTGPFSFVTRSRYWMTGMVTGGVILVCLVLLNLILRLFNHAYIPPPWQKIWLFPALCTSVGIPLITMVPSHAPSLPFGLALWVTAVTLVGLAMALLAGSYAGTNPIHAMLASIDGLGLSFILISAAGIEHISSWINRGAQRYVVLLVVMLIAGFGITLMMTLFRYFTNRLTGTARTYFIAGICVAYPGMSILHHTLFTDGYFYITDSDNFFARNIFLQIAIWVAVACYSLVLQRLREGLADKRK